MLRRNWCTELTAELDQNSTVHKVDSDGGFPQELTFRTTPPYGEYVPKADSCSAVRNVNG